MTIKVACYVEMLSTGVRVVRYEKPVLRTRPARFDPARLTPESFQRNIQLAVQSLQKDPLLPEPDPEDRPEAAKPEVETEDYVVLCPAAVHCTTDADLIRSVKEAEEAHRALEGYMLRGLDVRAIGAPGHGIAQAAPALYPRHSY